MSLPSDLLRQARHFATYAATRPRQADLRRYTSTSYYSVFHLLTDASTQILISGSGVATTELRHYLKRAYGYKELKEVCKSFAAGNLGPKYPPTASPVPTDLKIVSKSFIDLQDARHEADYDMGRRFSKGEALKYVAQAEVIHRLWEGVRKSAAARVFLIAILVHAQRKT